MTNQITFEEAKQQIFNEASGMQDGTLGVEDVDSNSSLHLIPYLIWKEINLGPARREVFFRAVEVTNMLRGVAGNIIYVPVLNRDEFEAKTASETEIDENGLVKSKLSPSEVTLTIGDVVYNATRISDILREDSPTLGWVRASLQKMGESVRYQIEQDIETALFNGAVLGGNVVGAATAGVLSYNDIIDVKTLMSTASFYSMNGEPFLLFMNPAGEGDLLKELGPTFTAGTDHAYAQVRSVERTRAGQPISSIYPLIAGCVPLVTTVQRANFALVAIPPTHPYGPSAIFAFKRPLTTEGWRDEQKQRDVWALSTRYGIVAKETSGLGLVSNC